MGSRSAWAKGRSVAVERMPPVIASAAVCCIVSIFFCETSCLPAFLFCSSSRFEVFGGPYV